MSILSDVKSANSSSMRKLSRPRFDDAVEIMNSGVCLRLVHDKILQARKIKRQSIRQFLLSLNGRGWGEGWKVRTRLLTRIYFFSKSAGNSAATRISSCTQARQADHPWIWSCIWVHFILYLVVQADGNRSGALQALRYAGRSHVGALRRCSFTKAENYSKVHSRASPVGHLPVSSQQVLMITIFPPALQWPPECSGPPINKPHTLTNRARFHLHPNAPPLQHSIPAIAAFRRLLPHNFDFRQKNLSSHPIYVNLCPSLAKNIRSIPVPAFLIWNSGTQEKNPFSSVFHQWLKNPVFGFRFGLGIAAISCLIVSMSFVGKFNELPLDGLVKHSLAADAFAVLASLNRAELSLTDFAQLISPAGAELLEPLCRRSQQLTQQRFGRVIRLFAPLYLPTSASIIASIAASRATMPFCASRCPSRKWCAKRARSRTRISQRAAGRR